MGKFEINLKHKPWKIVLRAQDTTWLVLSKLTNSLAKIVFVEMNITPT
jgi:hypothetical protein